MKNKTIIIINGEPNSIFLEILFKSLKAKSFRSPIILISSFKLFNFYMKKLKFKKKINIIENKSINSYNIDKNSINFIDVKIKLNNNIRKISGKSNLFIKKSLK